jgi:hypothetical protein
MRLFGGGPRPPFRTSRRDSSEGALPPFRTSPPGMAPAKPALEQWFDTRAGRGVQSAG